MGLSDPPSDSLWVMLGTQRKPRGVCTPRGLHLLRVLEALLPATATTAAATAARTAATTAATTALTFLRFIDTQRTTTHVLAVQGLDGALRIGARHFDEAEAARTARFAIIDQRNGLHRTVLFEQRPNVLLGSGKWQIANVDFRHTDKLSLKKASSAIARIDERQLRGLVTNGLLPKMLQVLSTPVVVPGLTFAVSSDFSEVGRNKWVFMTRLAKPEKKAGKGNERREIYAKA
jgi:hypothetical protein